MRSAMDLFIVFYYLIFERLVSAQIAVKNSNKETNRNTLQIRPVPVYMPNMAEYPQALPSAPPKKVMMYPLTTLYQGIRYQGDLRVFRKKFDYPAEMKGQQIICQGLFDCVISHIAIESSEAIPVLLRGGAGYKHFTAVIKAKPNRDLRGQVRVYCRNHGYLENKQSKKKPVTPTRRFFFGELLDEGTWR